MASRQSGAEPISTDIVQIQKMVFVFNAILAGWTVRMIDENTFEFKKERINREVDLDDYLRRFVMHNLSIESISARRVTSETLNPGESRESQYLNELSEINTQQDQLQPIQQLAESSSSTVSTEDIISNISDTHDS
ncbi:MAG: hypothetical protein ACXADH_15325 [Candidatus Kariarchaeaceae archaeon]|jgi:hypothetical protein